MIVGIPAMKRWSLRTSIGGHLFSMPRSARIDYPGALHHIISRGLDKQPIFLDHEDRDRFLNRLGDILIKSKTPCFAWALMPNHFHLLLTTRATSVSTLMQKLLTGHAVSFNRRHSRCGHLFQNRFRSILCQRDSYLLELVRYIHLNPIRGGLVQNLGALEDYSYCGHGIVLGRRSNAWQETEPVLGLFHSRRPKACVRYDEFIGAGLSEGTRADLVEGNLVRRHGEWKAVVPEEDSSSRTGCERILGDHDFIIDVIKHSNETWNRTERSATREMDVKVAADRVAAWMGLNAEDILSSNRRHGVARARSLLCYLAAHELGVSSTILARECGLTPSAISRAIRRGRTVAKDEGFSLLLERQTF